MIAITYISNLIFVLFHFDFAVYNITIVLSLKTYFSYKNYKARVKNKDTSKRNFILFSLFQFCSGFLPFKNISFATFSSSTDMKKKRQAQIFTHTHTHTWGRWLETYTLSCATGKRQNYKSVGNRYISSKTEGIKGEYRNTFLYFQLKHTLFYTHTHSCSGWSKLLAQCCSAGNWG